MAPLPTPSSASESFLRSSIARSHPSSAALNAAATASRWWKETPSFSCSRVYVARAMCSASLTYQ